LGFKLAKLWIEPRIIVFFLVVFVFWCWIGARFESWAIRGKNAVTARPSKVRLVLLALAASLWILVAIGVTFDAVFLVSRSSWYALRYLYGDLELMRVAQLLWSAVLASYYCRRFIQGLRAGANTETEYEGKLLT
jgi:hypothetical protein